MALIIFFFVGASAHAQVIFHVDKDQVLNATPDGLSWPNAYPTLTEAFTQARFRLNSGIPANYVTEIWVADGVYKPTASSTDRTATFHMVPNVAVYGGFAGSELTRAARAGNYDLTILSGDIDSDPRNQLADSLHVVTIDEAGEFRLDGFQVMFGAAVPSPPSSGAATVNDYGGGLLVTSEVGLADVSVTNVRFQACIAGFGGGAYVTGADLRVSRCNFVACIASLPSTLTGTVSSGGGGALTVLNSTAYVYNSSFTTNRASNGGALLFANNHQTRVVNCLIANNTAIAGGGVFMWSHLTPVVLDFCTMAGNVSLAPDDNQTAPYVGGGAVYMGGTAKLEVRSSIVWGNSDQNQVVPGSSHTIGGPAAIPVATPGNTGVIVTYSDFDITITPNWFATIQGVSLSSNNIIADPLFVNASAGNYRILPGSPCIDAADDVVFDTAAIPGTSPWNDSLGDLLDIDEDGIVIEFLPWDLDDATRELDLAIANTGRDFAALARIGDMGCYEQFLNATEP